MSKKADNRQNDSNRLLVIILMILFVFTLFITFFYIIKYKSLNIKLDNLEIIEITTTDTRASIINDGIIKQEINKDSFVQSNEIIVEKIDVVEIIPTNKNDDETIKFDIKYDITKNGFNKNLLSNNKSEVLVKFSYSYDKENWKYINNVISTNTSNISPLIGNTYDISGIIATLKVATNYKFSLNENKSNKMYWRSETIFKKVNDNKEVKNLEANFTIEYKSSN